MPSSSAIEYVAGDEGSSRLLELTGLKAIGLPAQQITFTGDLIRLQTARGDWSCVFEVGRATGSEPAAYRTGDIFVRYASADDKGAYRLAGLIAKRVRGTPFDGLLEVLRVDASAASIASDSDPESADESGDSDASEERQEQLLGSPDAREPSDRLDSHHEAQWWRFHYPEERVGYGRLEHGARWAQVHHASLECTSGRVRPELAPMRYFRGQPPYRLLKREEKLVSTMISEGDVLGGRTQARLDQTVEPLLASFDFVEVQTTCVPDLLGDNPSAMPVARLAPEQGKRGRLFWQCKTDEEDRRGFRDFLSERFAALGDAGLREGTKVLLLGAGEREKRALAGPLDQLGVSVAGTLLPGIELRGAQDPSDAALATWVDPRGWDWIDFSALESGFRVIPAPAPFGVEGSAEWLRALGEAAGIADTDERVAAQLKAIEPELEALRERSAAFRVALIGTTDELDALFRSEGKATFPLGRALLEMGFQVVCAVHGEVADFECDAHIHPFSTRRELDEVLASASLALSSFQHDRRLAAHALAGFDESFFGVGLRGFFAAAERLLRRCEHRPFAGHRHGLPRRRSEA